MSATLTRRVIAFVVAAALAVAAAVSLYSYVRGVEAEAVNEADAVVGYVATGQIVQGTLIDTAIAEGLVEQRDIPRDLLAAEAVTDLEQVRGRVVESTILPGDQLVLPRFAAPGEGVQDLVIPTGHQAMSFEVGVPPGVAGYVNVGDRVSVIARIDTEEQDEPVLDAEGNPIEGVDEEGTRVQYLLQDVEVLALGEKNPTPELDENGNEIEVVSTLMTVAVVPEEAERLAFTLFEGDLWLTLLPSDETDPVTTPGRTIDNIFEGLVR